MKKELLDFIYRELLLAKSMSQTFDGKTMDFAEVHEDSNKERGRVALFIGMDDGTVVGITVCDTPNV